MKLTEKIPVEGVLAYRVRRRGVIVEVVCEDNLVMDLPRNKLAQLIGGDGPAPAAINRIGFGTDNSNPEDGGQLLTTPFVKALGGHSYPPGEIGKVVFAWTLGPAEANGLAIQEFGLICTDDTLFSRRTRSGTIEKDEDVDLEGTWTILF